MSTSTAEDLNVEGLLAIQDEKRLEQALAQAEPGVAARAVAAAPTLERKTGLLWAMEHRQRREALELVPAPVIAAVVQNLEEDNRCLLGDLSLEQFRALLALCSPERQYYWITTALSFTDVRANALPLLLPTRMLAEILLTRAEFEAHIRAVGDFPIEHQRVPPDLMADPARATVDVVGPDHLLREFPVADPRLEQVLQLFLDYDPDRYVDLIREGLRGADYVENHPDEWGEMTESAVLLSWIPSPAAPAETDEEPAAEEPSVALAPVTASPLVRAVSALPPGRHARVTSELQGLFIRQAIADGGSFHRSDLQRAAASIEAYVLLGLEGADGGLGKVPVRKLAEHGARRVEALRQVAFRLRPLEALLTQEWRAAVRSLARPRLALGSGGEPRVGLLPGGSLPEETDCETLSGWLHDAAAWIEAARALGLERTGRALQSAGSLPGLLEELAVGAVLFARIEPGLAEPGDFSRFAARYVTRATEEPTPAARAGLRRTVQAWARERGLDYARLVRLLEEALERAALRALNEGAG